jgi:hypothetical protein
MFPLGLGLDFDRWLEPCWVVGCCLVDSGCLVVRFADGAVERGESIMVVMYPLHGGSRLSGGDGGNSCRYELIFDVSRFVRAGFVFPHEVCIQSHDRHTV